MAVKIYKLSGAQSEVSSDDTYVNPIIWEADKGGGTYEKILYLRNDEHGTSASDIKISATDASGSDESDWYQFSAFSFAPDNGGSPGEYVQVLEIPALDEDDEFPFWVRIVIPQAMETGPKTDISINVNAIIHNRE